VGFILREDTGLVWSTSPTTGSVEKVIERKTNRTVIHDLPGANKDIIQDLGTKCRKFTIIGTALSNPSITFLRSLPGTTGSIQFSNDKGFEIIPLTQVFYISVNFSDESGKPFERGFTLQAVEII